MMNAVISGRAGKGLLLDGDSMAVFDLDEPNIFTPVGNPSLPYLFGDAADLRFFEDTDHRQATKELEREYNFTCALDLTLILLDSELSEEVRAEASAELEELLADTGLIERLECVFYAHEFPRVADTDFALKVCNETAAQTVCAFLNRLVQHQPLIREVRQGWEAISDRHFEGDETRAEFLIAAVREGLFRDLVLELGGETNVGGFLLKSLRNSSINKLRNHRAILQEWSSLILSMLSGKLERDYRGFGFDMKKRIKWMLVGLGFTFGLQVLISLIFTGIAFSTAHSDTGTQERSISLLLLSFTIGSFLVGGFIIGWMEEAMRVLEAIIVAIVTLVLSGVIYAYLPAGNKGQFVTGLLLSGGPDRFEITGLGILFVVLALVAAAAGAYLGGRVSVPHESKIDRVALLLGLIGAVVGPFVLLAIGGNDQSNSSQPNLPWYFLVIVLLLLLLIVAAGFVIVMFTRDWHYKVETHIKSDARIEVRREH